MIPFNNFGHSKSSGVDMLYWVDASDSSSYNVDGSNNVTQLINKGSAGGVFNVIGSPKYLNGGFESHSATDYFTRDLGSPFLPNQSFTMAVTFDLTTPRSVNAWFYSLLGNSSNRSDVLSHPTLGSASFNSSTGSFRVGDYVVPSSVATIVTSYENGQSITIVSLNGTTKIFTDNPIFTNTEDASLILLNTTNQANAYSGANNPLHEFRLYDYAMTQQQMTDYRADNLKNKYGRSSYKYMLERICALQEEDDKTNEADSQKNRVKLIGQIEKELFELAPKYSYLNFTEKERCDKLQKAYTDYNTDKFKLKEIKTWF